jgi:hypothetical protein
MSAVILDACGTINLYASGRFVEILTLPRHEWYIPTAVERESQTCLQPDAADPANLISTPIDLAPALLAGALKRCECQDPREVALYVELASQIGDDGESMGLAIAHCRGWSVLTDDKKARRIAGELGVPVVGTPEVMRQWAAEALPGLDDLAAVLTAIERFSNYRPARGAVDYDWWVASVLRGEA